MTGNATGQRGGRVSPARPRGCWEGSRPHFFRPSSVSSPARCKPGPSLLPAWGHPCTRCVQEVCGAECPSWQGQCTLSSVKPRQHEIVIPGNHIQVFVKTYMECSHSHKDGPRPTSCRSRACPGPQRPSEHPELMPGEPAASPEPRSRGRS